MMRLLWFLLGCLLAFLAVGGTITRDDDGGRPRW